MQTLSFDHQPDVHVVKHGELLAALQASLDCLVLVYGAGQAEAY
jgi:hypothetical protein